MKYAFYITNHGFGHASRNVQLIRTIATIDSDAIFTVKSDEARCDFMKRNLENETISISYFTDCTENGLILKPGKLEQDLDEMEKVISEDFSHWNEYVNQERKFLSEWKPNIVISDVVCWAIKAAHEENIKTLLIGNFSWAQMYKSIFEDLSFGERYEEYYRLADYAMWYQIHSPELHEYCDYEEVSLVSRSVDWDEVDRIKAEHQNPIVFVSLGASAEISKPIDVEKLPYDFLTTRGIKLIGKNVYELPLTMTNTPDYIAVSDYIIAKGGWSTVAEILLQKKRSALLYRGDNSEDNYTRELVEYKGNCIGIEEKDLQDIETIINKMKTLDPDFSIYKDDSKYIAEKIIKMARG